MFSLRDSMWRYAAVPIILLVFAACDSQDNGPDDVPTLRGDYLIETQNENRTETLTYELSLEEQDTLVTGSGTLSLDSRTGQDNSATLDVEGVHVHPRLRLVLRNENGGTSGFRGRVQSADLAVGILTLPSGVELQVAMRRP